MDQPKANQEGLKSPFTNPLLINPDNITYGYEIFKYFEVRIVYIAGKLKGEYHLKPVEGVELGVLLGHLQNKAEGCEVNLVDRTGLLNLDYPIYVVVKDPMLFEAMGEVWKSLEQSMTTD